MNKEILIFLGSGASAPFGLPSMREMVDRFEKKLEKSNRTTKNETMIQLYGSIKKTILETYDYVDLESVFTVLLSISQKMKYADLGYTSLFAVSKVIADPKLNIATEAEVNTATKLLRIYKAFVRQACRLKESTEKRITDVYSDFFGQVGSKYASHKPLKGEDGQQYIYPYNSSIYTTNYDNVIETYWQGIEHINDLWKDTKGTLTLDVEKHEGDVPDLIKLHGSLDWLGLTDGTIIKSDKRRTTYAKRKVQGEFMLYPIQQKDLYLYPWFDLFYRFKYDLNQTKTWIAIGYSFNDEFILNIFNEALWIGDHRLILVDPKANDVVKKKFKDNAYKIRKILTKFGDKQTTVKIATELEGK